MPVKQHTCPICSLRTKKVHDCRIQKIKHLKVFERYSVIFYRELRYACSCGKKLFSAYHFFVNIFASSFNR
ncbi:transposase family protein [Niallia sp. 01092]|uniref:transposase family protein n=1 Tax=unclassified Niallia TaxID=2837522 RepID=UPI003FD18AEB